MAAKKSKPIKREVAKSVKAVATTKKSKRKKPAKPVHEAPDTRFFSRDESWLRFNQRVLEEAGTRRIRCWSG